jgi:hypothetical protein
MARPGSVAVLRVSLLLSTALPYVARFTRFCIGNDCAVCDFIKTTSLKGRANPTWWRQSSFQVRPNNRQNFLFVRLTKSDVSVRHSSTSYPTQRTRCAQVRQRSGFRPPHPAPRCRLTRRSITVAILFVCHARAFLKRENQIFRREDDQRLARTYLKITDCCRSAINAE